MASPRRAVLRRSGDETAAASAMLNTFFRDARMFSGTICVQRAAYKTVSNDTTSKRARFVLNVIKRLGSPRGAYRAACMRTSQNSVYANFAESPFHALGCIRGLSPPLWDTWSLFGVEKH
jgi:hypothetical protein